MEIDMEIVYLIVWIASGFISMAIANLKGRNPGGWFVIGFIFNLFGIIAAAVVSDLKKEEELNQARRLREENRVLRERSRMYKEMAHMIKRNNDDDNFFVPRQ